MENNGLLHNTNSRDINKTHAHNSHIFLQLDIREFKQEIIHTPAQLEKHKNGNTK